MICNVYTYIVLSYVFMLCNILLQLYILNIRVRFT